VFYSTAAVTATILSPKVVKADEKAYANECDSERLKKTIFNFPPKEFVYPKSFKGTWLAAFTFSGAQFTDKIPLRQLSADVNVAGFRKYSVAYLPDIGSDFAAPIVYRESPDGNIVEDRIANLKSIMESSLHDAACVADAVEYDASSNANRCTVKYHDSKGEGRLELFTNSRAQQTSEDKFSSFEVIRQSSIRVNKQQAPSQTYVDYGIAWDLQFNPDEIKGTMKVASYLVPQDEMYFLRPERPVGLFTYKVEMKRRT
jgi:hypothetical protein